MPRVPTRSADAVDVPRLVSALRSWTSGEATTRLPVAGDPSTTEPSERESSLNLIPAWSAEDRDAELARNDLVQEALDRDASRALHCDVDIPEWRRLTRRQMALAVERSLNTESCELPVGRTVVVANPIGRTLEYVRTPMGWERLRPLPELGAMVRVPASRCRARD
jgi:hypothetical protein